MKHTRDSAYIAPGVLKPRLLAADMMEVFGIKPTRFYVLLQHGKFDRFELKPKIGRRAWSGKKVQAYLDGELLSSLKRSA